MRFVTGIARLPFTTPVVQVCIKIMMAPGTVQLVFGVKLVIELDQGPLVWIKLRMIKHYGIFLRMCQRDETNKSGKSKDNQQKFNICHQNSFQLHFISKIAFRNVLVLPTLIRGFNGFELLRKDHRLADDLFK